MLSKLTRLLMILLPLFCADAEVFMRIAGDASSVLKSLGGSRVYQSSVEINGRKGELNSFVFNERSDTAAKHLAKKLKLPLPRSASAIMLDASGKTLTRYFVIQAPGLKESSIITALEQKASELPDSTQSTPPWPSGIPVLNATPQFTAYCEKDRSTLLCATSHEATPEQAFSAAASVLTGAGWTELLPSTPTFSIFRLEKKQSIVFTDINPTTGEITINVLQKEGLKQ